MRVEKVYKPNWADKMAGYLLIPVVGLPLFVVALVCTLFSDYGDAFMKEITVHETE